MKLNKKLSLVAAAMLAVSPVVTSVMPTQPVVAAKKAKKTKKSTQNVAVKRNINTLKKLLSIGNLNIVDSSENPLEVTHLKVYQNPMQITYTKSGDGKNGQGEYKFSQGLKAVGFTKSDIKRDYLIEFMIPGVGGDIIGRFTVPANNDTATGYISGSTTTNDEGDKFNVFHMGLPVSFNEPKAKKSKKSTKKVKKTKKSKKSSKSSKKVNKSKKTKKARN